MPYSEYAREETKRIAEENSHHMVGRDQTDDIEVDYDEEDNAEHFPVPQDIGEHHIALKFSSKVKQPSLGFTFGRNPSRCDICFQNDPHRRLSNIHFRIYLNEHAVLMLEDQSTNGTVVDDVLLRAKDNGGQPSGKPMKRTLVSGSKIKILMKNQRKDLVFLVRIPRREGRYQAAYQRNLELYMHEQEQYALDDDNKTIVPGPGGQVRVLLAFIWFPLTLRRLISFELQSKRSQQPALLFAKCHRRKQHHQCAVSLNPGKGLTITIW